MWDHVPALEELEARRHPAAPPQVRETVLVAYTVAGLVLAFWAVVGAIMLAVVAQ